MSNAVRLKVVARREAALRDMLAFASDGEGMDGPQVREIKFISPGIQTRLVWEPKFPGIHGEVLVRWRQTPRDPTKLCCPAKTLHCARYAVRYLRAPPNCPFTTRCSCLYFAISHELASYLCTHKIVTILAGVPPLQRLSYVNHVPMPYPRLRPNGLLPNVSPLTNL